MSNHQIFKELIQSDGKDLIFKKLKKYGLHFSIGTYLMLESHPAFAFAQVFIGKFGELRNGLVLIGKCLVGITAVCLIIKSLSPNGQVPWGKFGITLAVGCALMGVGNIIAFFGGQ